MGRKKEFTGIWIPRGVWEDDRLGIHDKVIFAVISGLARGESGCYATNKVLAEFCRCSERTVCASVSALTSAGYIRSEVDVGKTRKIFLCIKTSYPRKNCESTPADSATVPRKNCETPSQELQDPSQNLQGEDGSLPFLLNYNNNYNNIYNYAREETDTKPTKKEIEDWCRERGSSMNVRRFWEYYDAVNWTNRDGTPVNWKQRILSWEAQEERRAEDAVSADKVVPTESSFDTDEFFAASLARSEVPAADDDVPPWLEGG